MAKKVVIPKNRDIEEFVEEMERKEKRSTTKIVEDKRTKFKKSIEVLDKTQEDKEVQKQINEKFEKYLERKEAQNAVENRKQEYLGAMDKVMAKKEKEKNDDKDREQFLSEIQKKTEECLKRQKEEEKIKQEEKFSDKYKVKPEDVKKDKKKKEDQNKTKTQGSKTLGYSLGEILNSPEFKEMWENSQDGR